MPFIDLVIISDAKTDYFKFLTEQTIKSAVDAEKDGDIDVRPIVIEKQKIYYPDCMTFHQVGEFNYNRYCNEGAMWSSADYICFANNDLIFEKNWATEIIKEMELHNAVSARYLLLRITRIR